MAGRIDARLEELGIALPEAAPVANYVGWVKTGNPEFASVPGMSALER